VILNSRFNKVAPVSLTVLNIKSYGVLTTVTLLTTGVVVVCPITLVRRVAGEIFAVTVFITLPFPDGFNNTLSVVVVKETTGARGIVDCIREVIGEMAVVNGVTLVGNVKLIK
jgi:hypothetical protein